MCLITLATSCCTAKHPGVRNSEPTEMTRLARGKQSRMRELSCGFCCFVSATFCHDMKHIHFRFVLSCLLQNDLLTMPVLRLKCFAAPSLFTSIMAGHKRNVEVLIFSLHHFGSSCGTRLWSSVPRRQRAGALVSRSACNVHATTSIIIMQSVVPHASITTSL